MCPNHLGDVFQGQKQKKVRQNGEISTNPVTLIRTDYFCER
jgi:hypothetical protein